MWVVIIRDRFVQTKFIADNCFFIDIAVQIFRTQTRYIDWYIPSIFIFRTQHYTKNSCRSLHKMR